MLRPISGRSSGRVYGALMTDNKTRPGNTVPEDEEDRREREKRYREAQTTCDLSLLERLAKSIGLGG